MRYFFLLLLCSTLCYASADVQIKDLKAQVAEDGKSAGVQFLILNAGPENAAAIGARLSFDFNGKTVVSQEFPLQPLAPGAQRPEVLQVELPGHVTNLRAEIYDMQQADVQPFNNTLEAAVQMPGGNLADLEVSEGTIVSVQPVQDKNLVVRVHLVNHGPEAIANTRVTAELMLYQKTIAMVQKSPGKLAAGDERDLQFSILIPADLPSTEGLVVVRWLPADNSVQDVSLNNNSYSLPVNLVARQPDLVAWDVKITAQRELKFSVKNRGNAPAAATTTVLYLNGAQVKRFDTPTIPPGGERAHHYGGYKIPPGTQITLVLDYNAEVAEASEENNRFQLIAK